MSGPAGLRERLARDGFASVGPFLAEHEADLLRADLDRLLAEGILAASPHGILWHNLRDIAPAFAALLADGRLAALAREVLGADEVVLFQDNLVWKPPGTDDAISWHQDYSYMPLDRADGVTAWLAIDPADQGNGCLRYLPGTHLLGERQPADFIRGAEVPARPDLPPLDASSREAEAVEVPLPAGGLVLHHPFTWHDSPPNPSARHRRGWSLNWILPATRWDPAHAPHPYGWALSPAPGAVVEGPGFLRFGASFRTGV